MPEIIDLSDAAAGRFESGGCALSYRLRPPTAVKKGVKYPLAVFLHGYGERGDDNSHIAHGKSVSLPPEEIVRQYGGETYLLAPQCPADCVWVEWRGRREKGFFTTDTAHDAIQPILKTVYDLIKETAAKYPVDADRIYLTGLSMGAMGSWDLLARFPGEFAAAVPICGMGDAAAAAKIGNVPIWTLHGDADQSVPVECSRIMVDALRAAGSKTVKYTEYAGVDHGSWVNASAEKGLFDWLFSQRKGTA
jgi:predicted peptidase